MGSSNFGCQRIRTVTEGFIQAPDRPVTLEEIDKAIAEGAAEGSATR